MKAGLIVAALLLAVTSAQANSGNQGEEINCPYRKNASVFGSSGLFKNTNSKPSGNVQSAKSAVRERTQK